MTTNHHEDIFSSVTSRGAALWRSLSSSKMKQVQYETSMKNIPLGGEDPSGATDCTTQWNKQPELVILRAFEAFIKYVFLHFMFGLYV